MLIHEITNKRDNNSITGKWRGANKYAYRRVL